MVSSVIVAVVLIVAELPNGIVVPLIIIDELERDEFGMEVNPAPEPIKFDPITFPFADIVPLTSRRYAGFVLPIATLPVLLL